MTLASKFLATQAVTKLMKHLDTCHGNPEPQPIVCRKETLKRWKLALEFLIIDQNKRYGRQADNQRQEQAPRREQPSKPWQKSIENSFWVDSSESDRKNICKLAHQFAFAFLITTSPQLTPLATRMRNDKAASVKHPHELLQILERNALRREVRLKCLPNMLQGCLTIEHVQDGKLFFMKTKVVETHWFFDNPVCSAVIAMLARFQVRTTTKPQGPHRAVDERISHRCHECCFLLLDEGNEKRERTLYRFGGISTVAFIPSRNKYCPSAVSRFGMSIKTAYSSSRVLDRGATENTLPSRISDLPGAT